MTTKPLDRIRQSAQRDADANGKTYAILNLNTVGAAMYVIREYHDNMRTGRWAHQFVETVEPRP